jgi:hypothetical protein
MMTKHFGVNIPIASGAPPTGAAAAAAAAAAPDVSRDLAAAAAAEEEEEEGLDVMWPDLVVHLTLIDAASIGCRIS